MTVAEIAKRFGDRVAGLVEELTNDPVAIAELGKLEYHKRKLLKLTSWALVIKLCDRLHNVGDNPTAKAVADTLLLMDHLVANRKLSRPQTELVADIREVCVARTS